VPSTVEQLSPTRVKITVEVPFADLKPSMDKAYAEIAKTVNIPGFRRGKVPPMVIDQRFGRGVVLQEALNNSLEGFYRSAIVENKLSPLAQPELEVTKLEDGDLVEFTAGYMTEAGTCAPQVVWRQLVDSGRLSRFLDDPPERLRSHAMAPDLS